MKDRVWLVFWTIALTALFYLTSHAKADDYAFKYGMGLEDKSPTGNIKLFSLRQEALWFYAFHYATEGGLWVDNLGNGRASGAFGKAQMGVKPGAETGVYAKAFWGVQLQSSTDTQLGGYAQFTQDAGIGIRDRVSSVELGYTHVSSAGIFSPNLGRDFITLSLGIRW